MIPSFSYYKNPSDALKVVFQNSLPRTSGGFILDFGDNTPVHMGTLDTFEEVEHTYSTLHYGSYITATMTVGANVYSEMVPVSPVELEPLSVPWETFIAGILPGVTIPLIHPEIRKWQNIINKSLSIPYKVAPAYMFHEVNYNTLPASLICYLVALDYLTNQINAFAISSTTGGGDAGKILKKVVTGPTEAEWQNNADSIKALTTKGGLMDLVTRRVCNYASLLSMRLGICDVDELIIQAQHLKVKTPT